MRGRFYLPLLARNPLSLVGIAVATAAATLFLVFLLLELLGLLTNPYIGLLLFVAIPAAFILALLLIPIGMWWSARRTRRGGPAPEWPVVDLRTPHHRSVVTAVLALTAVNVVVISMAASRGVHYMETAQFCGRVCHTTMEPQYTAYQAAPHARVACVQCHVGSGMGALVESKIAGTRQFLEVATNTVTRPVPSPVRSMRPARDTCEQCHWPEKFHADTVRVIREYADDEENTETATTLVLHVGGGSAALGVGTGIHWHMNLDNEIEYVATDPKRETIPYVRLRDRAGNVREYVVDGTTPEQLAAGERRRMDCMDCHNRPAHTFTATPERAVDAAIAQGRIPRELPFVRRQAVAAVKPEYPNRDAALAAIAAGLRNFYRPRGADSRVVERVVAATQDVWSRNVFPAMRVSWGTYPNFIGHVDAPGCFRCHDDNHKAKDGSVIGQDCELCHGMPSQ
jgi:nitrate/TMAO reductase-like tetraheme cytochrome c subunit